MALFPPSNQNQVTVLCISQTRVLQELTGCAPSAGATSHTRISGIGHVVHVSGHGPGSELSYTRNRTTRTWDFLLLCALILFAILGVRIQL